MGRILIAALQTWWYDKSVDWKVRKGRIEELDRSFDYDFWQSQSPLARLEAAWQMVIDYHIGILGQNEDQLRLQRSVVAVKKQEC